MTREDFVVGGGQVCHDGRGGGQEASVMTGVRAKMAGCVLRKRMEALMETLHGEKCIKKTTVRTRQYLTGPGESHVYGGAAV